MTKDAEIYLALLDDGTQFTNGIAAVRKVLGAHRYTLGAMIDADDDAHAEGRSIEVALRDFRDQPTALATLADAALARWDAHTA